MAVLGVLVVIIAGLVLIKVQQIQTMIQLGQSMPPPSETVSSAEAEEQVWQPEIFAVGSLTPVQGVTLEAEVSGVVEEIAFENGQRVEAGALLIQLDDDVEQAEMKAARATARLARMSFERAQSLRETDAISQSQLDQAEAELARAEATVDNLQAVIEKKSIRAPFTGVTGIRQVNLGEFLGAGTPIVTLQSFDPIFAEFTLPQQELPRLKAGLAVRVETDALPGREFEGVLTAISPEVEVATRNVRLQATLENDDLLLRPGLFVRVHVQLSETREVVVVPSSAILPAPYGDSVFIIEEAEAEDGTVRQTVRQKFVRTGERRGDYVEVVEGLEPGEQIASAGLFKLRNGMVVNINNQVSPNPALAPEPANI
ncbi:MAG: efflux RND transporter periplasmic adaptor subunit [Verrucomicrobiota bacterium]